MRRIQKVPLKPHFLSDRRSTEGKDTPGQPLSCPAVGAAAAAAEAGAAGSDPAPRRMLAKHSVSSAPAQHLPHGGPFPTQCQHRGLPVVVLKVHSQPR